MSGEMTGFRLNTVHNVHFFLQLTAQARKAIVEGRFPEWKAAFFKRYPIEKDHWEENQKRRAERRNKHLAENSAKKS